MENENLFLIDWVSISTKELDEVGIQALAGLNNIPWQTIYGCYGFKERLYYEGIGIHYNGRDDQGVLLEMSGQGCRTFESLGSGDFEKLFDFVRKGHGKLNRLDIAFDDHSGLLDINQLWQDAQAGNVVSRFRNKGGHWSDDTKYDGRALTVEHGSMKSQIFVRIYDKAAERHCSPDVHWVRVEMQLRKDRANKFIELDGSIGERFTGVMSNYIRYVEPLEGDSNKWRWPLKDYWADFLGDAVGISLYEKPGMEYNVDHLENFVFKQAGNAIDTAIQISGIDVFLRKLAERHTLPNPKYRNLLDKLFRIGKIFEELPDDAECPF